MYLRDLDKKKIDRKFVLTPGEFFNMFFGDYNYEDNNCHLSPQELFFILSDYLHYCSNSQVRLDNILTGKIILVGFDKGLVKAYYRPIFIKKKVEPAIVMPGANEVDDIDEPSIFELSLGNLIDSLNSCIEDPEKYGVIYDEILVRAGIREEGAHRILTKKY